MVIRRGDIWWASLPQPRDSEPGYRRPVLVVQNDDFNRSHIDTVIVVVLTSSLNLADAPGNVLLTSIESGLPKDSVVNVSQIITLDRGFLDRFVACLGNQAMMRIDEGLRLALSLP